MLNASDVLRALGEEMVTMTSGETGAPSTWGVVAVPATELPVPELPDELIGADRVTRVKDARGGQLRGLVPKTPERLLKGGNPR